MTPQHLKKKGGARIMKTKRFWLMRPLVIILMALSLVLCAALFFTNRILFFVSLPIVLVINALAFWAVWRMQRDLYKIITQMGKSVSGHEEGGLIDFPMSAMIVTEEGEIVWYNEQFRAGVLQDEKDIYGAPLSSLFKEEISQLLEFAPRRVECYGRYYDVYTLHFDGGRPFYILYFSDVTKLEMIRQEAERTRPSVMMVLIDNYDETVGQDGGDGGRLQLLNQVRNTIQAWVDSTTGFIRRLAEDRYIMLVEEQDLQKMLRNRFEILDQVRLLETENRIPMTLSIGIAPVVDTLNQAAIESRKALEMALGRGGDQVVLKTDNGYEFFGGYSKGVEKQTKVKTRIVASALAGLIKGCDNVLVMGHRFADLDALGSAIGLAKACRCLGKDAYIVLDTRRNVAEVLVRKLVENRQQDMICMPETALELISEKTLLIITDTHTADLVESAEVYKRCNQVVVIDHHRRTVNHIDNAVIFYHEPFASSASEMVAELIQYLGDGCRLNRTEAEALLAGIMLDTKNFVMKTGARTFEAAAYLRRLGADTVAVREMFGYSIDAYRHRALIVSSAELMDGCAVSICANVTDDIRIVAPQAADELLNISGVKASFVLYESNGTVYVSARSMGAYNVQVIMEKMGGGGHLTMAGAQVKDSDCYEVRARLAAIIEEYAAQQERKEG